MGESDLRSRAVIQGKQVVHRLIGQGRAILMFKLRPEWKEDRGCQYLWSDIVREKELKEQAPQTAMSLESTTREKN